MTVTASLLRLRTSFSNLVAGLSGQPAVFHERQASRMRPLAG